MSKNKTTETDQNVIDYINAVKDESKRQDSFVLVELMRKLTGFAPKMWGPSIIGFGSYHYKYESGREGDSTLVGFSPRAAAFSLYLSAEFENREELLAQFGKHKAEKSCIYVKKLADIDMKILEKMIVNHLKYMKKTYPDSK